MRTREKHTKTRENTRKNTKTRAKNTLIARQSSEKHGKAPPTKTRKTIEKHAIPATFTRVTSY